MPAVTVPDDVDDMVASTLRRMDPPNFTMIATGLQKYLMMKHWLKKERVKIRGGRGIQESLMSQTAGVARHSGIYDADTITIGQHMVTLNIPWVHADTHYGWIYQEALMNVGRSLVTNLLSPRRAGAIIDLAQELEEKAFAVPNTTNKTEPRGVPYWLVANASDGFNGGYPSGPDAVAYTDLAGVDLDTHTRFKNYTATYTAYNDESLLDKMRDGHMLCKWESPITLKDFYGPLGERYKYYCAKTLYKEYMRLARMQNDNLGAELDPMKNPIFNRHPFVWVPYLDDNEAQTSILYQIDHDAFRVVVLSGENMRQTGPKDVGGAHNQRVVFVDLMYNFECIDRRSCAVFYKV